jgi:hypothetical protein
VQVAPIVTAVPMILRNPQPPRIVAMSSLLMNRTGAGRTFAAFAVILASGRVAFGDEASPPGGLRPIAVRIISVENEIQPPGPEIVAAPESHQALPARDDAKLITQVLSRPQPQQPLAAAGEAVGHRAGTTRLWEMSISAWEAPAFCHRPLYFEDESLERHGRSLGILQPAASTVHFAGRTVVWPYLAGTFPPHECIYTLGHERPGTCAAYRLYRPPLSGRGAVYQAGAVAGLSFIVP